MRIHQSLKISLIALGVVQYLSADPNLPADQTGLTEGLNQDGEIGILIKNIDEKEQSRRQLVEELSAKLNRLAQSGVLYDLGNYIKNPSEAYITDWAHVKSVYSTYQHKLESFSKGLSPSERIKKLQDKISEKEESLSNLELDDNSHTLMDVNHNEHDLTIIKETLEKKKDELNAMESALSSSKGRLQGLESQSLRATSNAQKEAFAKRIDELTQAIQTNEKNIEAKKKEIDTDTKIVESMEQSEPRDTKRHAALVEKRGERRRIQHEIRDLRLELRKERAEFAQGRTTRAHVDNALRAFVEAYGEFINKHINDVDDKNNCLNVCSKMLIDRAGKALPPQGTCSGTHSEVGTSDTDSGEGTSHSLASADEHSFDNAQSDESDEGSSDASTPDAADESDLDPVDAAEEDMPNNVPAEDTEADHSRKFDEKWLMEKIKFSFNSGATQVTRKRAASAALTKAPCDALKVLHKDGTKYTDEEKGLLEKFINQNCITQ